MATNSPGGPAVVEERSDQAPLPGREVKERESLASLPDYSSRCVRCGTERPNRKGTYVCPVQESPGCRIDVCIWKGSPYAKGAECYQRRDNPMRPLRPAPGSTKAIDAGCTCPVEANYDGAGLVGVGVGRGIPMLYDQPGLRGGDPGATQREYWLHLRCPLHGELLTADSG